ncbi:hypothetical protein [Olsenella profusa]|uniref:DUF4037 domain-containing protein n=1 Tax=Olsenella profusa TaxID=138595 RepID=A0ABS2F086_9ACTN|nr:hypothetical protein [Olsenella profusa]MBM6774381.1 hypothetical protein [Olsenella profusa]
MAIFPNALHVDLYVAELRQIGGLDPVMAWHDPKGLFDGTSPKRVDMSDEELCRHFSSAVYYLVEASSAYGRGNHAWAADVMSAATSELAVLLRYPYDRRYAFLAMKKINEIVPAKKYQLLESIYACLGRRDSPEAARMILDALDVVLASADASLAAKLDARFLRWAQAGMGTVLFGGAAR